MIREMIKDGTNIIHWVGHCFPLTLLIAKLIATLRLPIPPLFIYEKNRTDFSAATLLNLYNGRFNK
jgi:hypothetical protein